MAQLVNKQFDVVTNPSVASRDNVPYIVVLQSHYLTRTDTVLVAPLIRPDLVAADHGTSLAINFNGTTFTLDLGLMASVRRSILASALGSLASYDYEIRRGLDRLFTGF